MESEMLYNNGLNMTVNDGNKLAANDFNVNQFKKNKNIIKHLIIKNNILKNENHDIKSKIFREISNKKRIINKKGFIDTSISFENSRGLTHDKYSANNQNENKVLLTDKNTNELNHINNNKLKDKDLKYLKLKSKNKKFGVLKIDEDYMNKNDDKIYSLNLGNRKKAVTKRNRFEKVQNPFLNYTSLNSKNNNNNNKILNLPDDISSIKIKKEKTKKIEESIKKISINKKHLLTLLNEPKNYFNLEQPINTNTNNDNLKTCNNEKKSEDEKNLKFYQTFINADNKQNLTLNNNIKKRYFKSNFKTIENNDKSKIDNKEEYFEPFDLSSIFFNNIDSIKENIIKAGESKKWKYRVKKKGCVLSKNNEQIDFNICNNCNIAIVKAIKKKGNIQKCKSIINLIISKID